MIKLGKENILDDLLITETFQVYPQDLPDIMTYLEAEFAVAALGDGWRIPTLAELRLMCKYKQDIHNFYTGYTYSSGYPYWYWSSTKGNNDTTLFIVRLLNGDVTWIPKDYGRYVCRPVRSVDNEYHQ